MKTHLQTGLLSSSPFFHHRDRDFRLHCLPLERLTHFNRNSRTSPLKESNLTNVWCEGGGPGNDGFLENSPGKEKTWTSLGCPRIAESPTEKKFPYSTPARWRPGKPCRGPHIEQKGVAFFVISVCVASPVIVRLGLCVRVFIFPFCFVTVTASFIQ